MAAVNVQASKGEVRAVVIAKKTGVKKEVNRGAWTDEEDQKLAETIKIYGPKKWKTIAAKAGLAPTFQEFSTLNTHIYIYTHTAKSSQQ